VSVHDVVILVFASTRFGGEKEDSFFMIKFQDEI